MINKLPRLILTLFVAGIFFCSILPFAEPVSVIHDDFCPLSDPVYLQSPEASDHAREICEGKGICYEKKLPNGEEPPSKNAPPPSNNAPPPSNNAPPSNNGQTTNDNGQTTNDNESNFSVYFSAFGSVLFLLF